MTIALPDDKFSTVLAFATSTPGLAVHRHIEWPAYDATGETWTVTHIASGRAIGQYYPSRRSATEAARGLRLLADWTKPMAEVQARFRGHPRRKAQVQKICAAGKVAISV